MQGVINFDVLSKLIAGSVVDTSVYL